MEIAQLLLANADKYATVQEKMIPKYVQSITHKKKRINKKYKKLYGSRVIYEKKMAKVIEVTYETIIQFCADNNLPLPDELLYSEKET
jgi:hypothetical protein